MNAERRANMSRKIKQRWGDATTIAKHLSTPPLEITKYQVYNYLHDEFVKADKLEQALRGDTDVLEWIKTTDGWARMTNQPRIHQPEQSTELPLGQIYSDEGDVLTEMDQLRIGAWFIKKVSGIANARRILEAAAASFDKLRKPTRKG
jgi:hypothetical protein